MSLIHEFLRMQVSAGVGILVPQPGIEPGSSAVKVRSPNHSDVREFWEWTFFFSSHTFISLSDWAHKVGVTFSGIRYKKKSLTLDFKKHPNVQNSATFSPFFL